LKSNRECLDRLERKTTEHISENLNLKITPCL